MALNVEPFRILVANPLVEQEEQHKGAAYLVLEHDNSRTIAIDITTPFPNARTVKDNVLKQIEGCEEAVQPEGTVTLYSRPVSELTVENTSLLHGGQVISHVFNVFSSAADTLSYTKTAVPDPAFAIYAFTAACREKEKPTGWDALTAVGYEQWSPGALEKAIGEGQFVVIDFDAGLAFTDPVENRSYAARKMAGLVPEF